MKVVSAMMNWRSRLTGICTGDQAIFVTRQAFEQLAGFAPIALMEDIEFSKRARSLSWPAAIRALWSHRDDAGNGMALDARSC